MTDKATKLVKIVYLLMAPSSNVMIKKSDIWEH